MLVSTRAATAVELFPLPTSILRRAALLRAALARFLAPGGLIEMAKTLLRGQHGRLRPGRDDRDRFSRSEDFDLITDADAVGVDQPFGQGDLEFAGYAGHAGHGAGNQGFCQG